MTESEARLFFPFEEGDDLEDLYDERLFEYKQFFLTKAVVGRVFRAKIEKLLKFEKAYSVVSGIKVTSILEQVPIVDFPSCVSEAFAQFEQIKGEIRQKISQARNSMELIPHVERLIQVVRNYYQAWHTETDLEIGIDSISKEPDSMEILRAIKAFESAGGKTFSDILEQKGNEELQKEMKRVSLLLEKFD